MTGEYLITPLGKLRGNPQQFIKDSGPVVCTSTSLLSKR
jgi:hypothetical protein